MSEMTTHSTPTSSAPSPPYGKEEVKAISAQHTIAGAFMASINFKEKEEKQMKKDRETLLNNEELFVELEGLLGRVSIDIVQDNNTTTNRERYNSFVESIQNKAKELGRISTTP